MNYRIVDLGNSIFNFLMNDILEKRPCTEEDKEYLLKEKLVWYNDEPNSEWQKTNPDMLCCDSDTNRTKIYSYLMGNETIEDEFNQHSILVSVKIAHSIFREDIFDWFKKWLNYDQYLKSEMKKKQYDLYCKKVTLKQIQKYLENIGENNND